MKYSATILMEIIILVLLNRLKRTYFNKWLQREIRVKRKRSLLINIKVMDIRY